MPALSRADDRAFVDVMQRIVVAIVNPWFLVCFLGAPAFIALAAVLHLRGEGGPGLPWIVAGFVGDGATLVITFGFNVPLNNALAAAENPDRIAISPRCARASNHDGCAGTSPAR